MDRFVIGRFLKRPEVKLYLRTEEMARSWREYYKDVSAEKIDWLPSLEIPDDKRQYHLNSHSGRLAFGIIGQIRIGKGIEWLVPAFQKTPSLGKLTVAGEFASAHSRDQLSVLEGYDGFVNCFMTEDDMLERAAEQDYLLMLYDLWDKRMESAVLYLAARVNRPVIVYGDNWSGRMVREFECGVEVPADKDGIVDALMCLPRPGSAEYADLLKGMDTFRQAHSVEALRGRVVQKLLT